MAIANPAASRAVSKIISTANNAGSVASYLASIVSSRTKLARFLGFTTIGNFKDAINAVSYTSVAISAIIVGCSPPQSVPFSIDGTAYPEAPACLSVSNTNCSNTTVGCQAAALISLSSFHVRNLNFANQYLKLMNAYCDANSTQVNITDAQDLIDLWVNITASATVYVSSSQSGPLIVAADANFVANLTAALNLTAEYLNSYANSSELVLNCTKGSKIRVSSSGERRNFFGWVNTQAKRHRRNARNRAILATSSFYASVVQSLSSLSTSASNFAISVNGIASSSFVFNAALSHSNAFNNLISRINASLSRFALFLKSFADALEQAKTYIVVNATNKVNDAANALIANITADNNTNCLNFTSQIAEAIANFALNVEACAEGSDNKTDASTTNSAEVYRTVMINVSAVMNATQKCYCDGCVTNLLYPFSSNGVKCANDPAMSTWCTKWIGFIPTLYSCPSSYANSIINCLASVSYSF